MELKEYFSTKKSRLVVTLLLICSVLASNYVSVIAQSSSFAVQAITVGTGVSTVIDLPSAATTVAGTIGTTVVIAPHTAGTTVATTAGTTVGTTVRTTVSMTAATTTATTVATTTATATNTFTPHMAPSDFSIGFSASSLTVAQGSSGNVQVSVTASNNYASPVSLTFSGTSGITGLFSTNPVATSPGGYSNFYAQDGTATSMLSISVLTNVAPGVYPVTVTGSSTDFSHFVTLAVNVIPVSTMASSMNSVNIANKPGIGSYLTNATGWTLYTFARDIPTNGTSRCTGNCIQNWPVFYTTNLTLPSGLNATSFTVITRPDGAKQVAYNGWPLYYFRSDTKPGDTNGQGFAKAWFACTFPTPFTIIMTSNTTTSAVAPAEREGY